MNLINLIHATRPVLIAVPVLDATAGGGVLVLINANRRKRSSDREDIYGLFCLPIPRKDGIIVYLSPPPRPVAGGRKRGGGAGT